MMTDGFESAVNPQDSQSDQVEVYGLNDVLIVRGRLIGINTLWATVYNDNTGTTTAVATSQIKKGVFAATE